MALTGDEAAGVIIPFPSRGCSNTFEVCAELLDCDEPEVFLLSWLCLVENWTKSGDDGWDGLLGDDVALLGPEGEPR